MWQALLQWYLLAGIPCVPIKADMYVRKQHDIPFCEPSTNLNNHPSHRYINKVTHRTYMHYMYLYKSQYMFMWNTFTSRQYLLENVTRILTEIDQDNDITLQTRFNVAVAKITDISSILGSRNSFRQWLERMTHGDLGYNNYLLMQYHMQAYSLLMQWHMQAYSLQYKVEIGT